MTRFFGERVRLLRQARGLRVREVAAALDLSAARLSQVERGLTEPDDSLVQRAAAYFDESEDELLLLAGRVPPDLGVILQQHPAESALLLREHFSDARSAPDGSSRGATFVPAALGDALTQWAIRSPSDIVLDPSCADGALLASAGTRLLSLGATPASVLKQLHGYEADPEAYARAMGRLRALAGGGSPLIRREDFLDAEAPARLPFQRTAPPPVSALVGVVSSGGRSASVAQRRQAHAAAAEAGIDLPETAAPWAALIIHAASFVRPDGRLALAVPAAVLHAHYAAAVRSYMAQLFPALTVVTFSKSLPGVGEVVVLLGDAAGERGVRALRVLDPSRLPAALSTSGGSGSRVAEGRPLRWSAASLPTPALALLRSLQRGGVLRRLGELARIDAGLVTGANRLFVLDAGEAERVDPAFLRPALCTAGAAAGLIFGVPDWQALRESGASCFLLCIPHDAEIDAHTRKYLERGEREGIPDRTTCRRRPVWYALNPPDSPAGLLTYLCRRQPRMLVNEAGVTHVNALHSVRPIAGASIIAVAASFTTTATLLGCELLGRHYGGGVLKLEPGEVKNLLVPDTTKMAPETADALLHEADGLWRGGRQDDAIDLVDQTLLRRQLGVDEDALAELRRCYAAERARRSAT